MLDGTGFSTIAEILPEAVVVTDPNGCIVWTNQAFHDLCGYSRSYVRNRKPGSFLQGRETDSETVDRIRTAIKRKKPVAAELVNYHQDGHPYWVSLKITPLKDAGGRLTGFIALEHEITERQHRIESLQEQVAELYGALIGVINPANSPMEAGTRR